MYTVKIKAKHFHAAKNIEDKYYMVGLSDAKENYKKYILLQKTYDLSEDDDPEADVNGAFLECNGDMCVKCCTKALLNKSQLILFVKDSKIEVDITKISLPPDFIEYIKYILQDIIEVEIS